MSLRASWNASAKRAYGKYTGSLSFEDVIREAQDALGKDPYGYRAEFVERTGDVQCAPPPDIPDRHIAASPTDPAVWGTQSRR